MLKSKYIELWDKVLLTTLYLVFKQRQFVHSIIFFIQVNAIRGVGKGGSFRHLSTISDPLCPLQTGPFFLFSFFPLFFLLLSSFFLPFRLFPPPPALFQSLFPQTAVLRKLHYILQARFRRLHARAHFWCGYKGKVH